MAIFGNKKHAVARYSLTNRNIEFLCNEDGSLAWLGALHEVYEYVADLVGKCTTPPKKFRYLFAVDNTQYMRHKFTLQQAVEGVNTLLRPDDFLLSNHVMTRISFHDFTSCVAFPSVNYYTRKLAASPNDHKLRAFIEAMTREPSHCCSCGQTVVSPPPDMLLERLESSPDIQRIMNKIYDGGVYCIPCATMIMCTATKHKLLISNKQSPKLEALMQEAKDIVLDEDKDMKMATPIIMELAGSLGGVGLYKAGGQPVASSTSTSINPWLE